MNQPKPVLFFVRQAALDSGVSVLMSHEDDIVELNFPPTIAVEIAKAMVENARVAAFGERSDVSADAADAALHPASRALDLAALAIVAASEALASACARTPKWSNLKPSKHQEPYEQRT